jgi:hypothetical protein
MIKIVYTPVGIVIGEKVNAEIGLLALKNPRVMQPSKTETGQMRIDVVPMLGNPKGFEIERGAMNYDCNDENILKAYQESVTGISLVKKPPLVDAGGKALQ